MPGSKRGSRPGSARARGEVQKIEEEARARMSRLARKREATDFIFLAADKLRACERTSTLPPLQELEQWPGWTQRIPISILGCMHGTFVREVLTVSHRWETKTDPDPTGAQFRAVRAAVCANLEIKWVWYDFWCLYQKTGGVDTRTDLQKYEFKQQLPSMNLLYIGTSVLILLDPEYDIRFWTNFEAYVPCFPPFLPPCSQRRH